MNKVGFTLAEVLITLGIIGIVAAMTLPTLMFNTQNKELEAALKKGYSSLSQAITMYNAEAGEPLTPQNTPLTSLKPILMNYMNVAHDCGNGENYKSCILDYSGGTGTGTSSSIYKTYNGMTAVGLNFILSGQFVLNDGMLIAIEEPGNTNYLHICIDVNGHYKRPNKLGHDLFVFAIDNEGALVPMGIEGTRYYSENNTYCSVSSASAFNGAGCTYKAFSQKDYFKNLPR